MSSRRPPSPPPDLPGFAYQRLLGSGGFADVFLYEQEHPRREVAIKVLLPERLKQGSATAFSAEANIMAQLAAHPAIVTIYQAGLSSDGRSYLVMEYCPRPNLQVRYRKEPFSVAETLHVGVQVSGAVETAHRAGILHRDIKPANILVTQYNRPALTDFGISVAQGGDDDNSGMSVPWSPPEMFADSTSGDETADVYSLGATLYTLLAGRSPFEIPGQRNSNADLMQRIASEKLPPLGRVDVPDSLARVLERAMAKSPTDRYATALEFARQLQHVQAERNESATPIDVLDENIEADVDDDDDDGRTRIRKVVVIDPTAPPGPTTTTRPTPDATPSATTGDAGETIDRRERADVVVGNMPGIESSEFPDTTVRRPGPEARAEEPSARESPAEAPSTPGADEVEVVRSAGFGSRHRVALSIVAGLVILGGAGVAWAAASGAFSPSGAPSSAPTDVDPQDPGGTTVPRVEDLEGTVEGEQVVFTWTNPDPKDGDRYDWTLQRPGEEGQVASVSEATVTVPADASGTTCIEVVLVRANGTSAATGTEKCAP